MKTHAIRWAILAAALASRPLWSQEHTLAGTVKDSTGRPLAAVLVSIRGAGRAVETDSGGRFSLGGLAPDTVLVSFEKAGYQVGRMRILIRETDEPELPLGSIQLKDAALGFVTVKFSARDQSTGQPIEGTALELNGRARVYTSRDGSVTDQKVQVFTGLNTAVARRIGYQAVTFDLWLPEGEHEVTLEATLKAAPVALAPVVVVGDEVRVRYRWSDAFYQGLKAGLGDFLTQDRIKQVGSFDAVGLLRWLPGHSVEVTGDPFSGYAAGPIHGYHLRLVGVPGGCDPLVYLNGLRTSMSSALDQLEMTAPEDVLGIAVYRHAGEIPPEFNSTGSTCGVIAFWIRR